MKASHRADIFTFSVFDPVRNVDFNGWFLRRDAGNVLVDPVAMSDHDVAHAKGLGGVAWIVITNSDHVRASVTLASVFGAKIAGPAAERDGFPIACDRWLAAGDDALAGIEVVALAGSKTPGELALVVDDTTAIFGDLVRAHRGGGLHLLPPEKLVDREAALASLRPLAERGTITAVLVGDGWPMFERAGEHLRALVQ